MSGAHVTNARCYWPAGLEELSPAERAEALARGWWRDGDEIVTRDGRRIAHATDAETVATVERYLAWLAERPL